MPYALAATMDQRGLFVASILEASAKALAVGAVERTPREGSEPTALDLWGFEACVADAERRVRALAGALAVGRPELLALDVGWLRATHAAHGLPPAVLDATLRALREELAQSLPPDARALAERFLAAADAEPVPDAATSALRGARRARARTLLDELLAGRRRGAEEVVRAALDEGLSLAALHLEVIGPVQEELGRLWQTGEIDVAQEHHASAVNQDLLALARARLVVGAGAGAGARAGEDGRRVVVAAVCGSLHEIGARMVADQFELAGWETLFLGADVPAPDLTRAVGAFGADLLALSAVRTEDVRAVARTIEEVRAAQADLPVLVGGPPFRAIPDLWRDVGASGSAPDAVGAVERARRLLAD